MTAGVMAPSEMVLIAAWAGLCVGFVIGAWWAGRDRLGNDE